MLDADVVSASAKEPSVLAVVLALAWARRDVMIPSVEKSSE